MQQIITNDLLLYSKQCWESSFLHFLIDKGRWNSFSFFTTKSGCSNDNVHFFTLSHKGLFYVLQWKITHVQVHFQQSLTKDCCLLLWNSYVHNSLCICNSNIKDLNVHMCLNHISNGHWHKKISSCITFLLQVSENHQIVCNSILAWNTKSL